MNTRMKLAIVLAGVAGILLATAGSFAYAQSTTQQSGQASCGTMMNNRGGMGMMGGMNQYGSMSQDQCRGQMSQSGMGQCQGFMASGAYAMLDQNTPRTCH